MNVNRAKEAAAAQDPALKQLIYTLYNLKITQKLVEDRELFARAAYSLDSIEIRLISELYVLNGQYNDGLKFLHRALQIATVEKSDTAKSSLAAIELALANTNLRYSGSKNIKESREHLKKAIDVSWDINQQKNNYLYYNMLSEAAIAELQFGDWDCGKKISDYALQNLSSNFVSNPEVTNYMQLLRNGTLMFARKPNNIGSACDYPFY